MKFGLLVEYETRNIGDDIQAYVTKRFLPRVDYYIDRNHLDEFVPNSKEKVAMITNGWFLQYTLNWPPSPYIKPLPISMHFTNKDWFWDTTDRAYHLQGYGLDYLKSIEPIGCRDSHTVNLLTQKGIKTEYTGCMTLTLQKFDNVEKGDYICAVDVSDAVYEQIKNTTDLEVKKVTHIVPEDYYKLSWNERMKNVEDLLKLYQGARAVVSYRLHCALPCLALGTPTILLNEDYRNDRFGDYLKYMESCTEEEFVSGKVQYDYKNLPKKDEGWKELRKNLEKRCEDFVEKYEQEDGSCEDEINIEDYKKYVINKSNWLKKAANESYQRFEKEKENLAKKDNELNETKLKYEQELDKIEEEKNKTKSEKTELGFEKEYYKKEFENAVKQMDKYKSELEKIRNSRWWKIREKIKGNNKN